MKIARGVDISVVLVCRCSDILRHPIDKLKLIRAFRCACILTFVLHSMCHFLDVAVAPRDYMWCLGR